MDTGTIMNPCILVLVLVLACCVLCNNGQDAPLSSQKSTRAFFTGSSRILLPSTVLRFNKHIAFTFRTCSPGRLLYQEGSDGSNFTMSVTDRGGINLVFSTPEHHLDMTVGGGLTDNQWYTVDSNFKNGQIQFTVERGQTVKHLTLISNSTYNRFVWDIDLSGGVPVYVGFQFVGCLLEGPSVRISENSSQWENVQPDVCPLKTDLNYGDCQEELPNPCWQNPCKNGGTCESTADHTTYSCSCLATFIGPNCETDIGNEACEHSICQNGGTCETLETGSTRSHECICATGFRGLYCETDIDECASGPCKNDAECIDMVNGYVCKCNGTGYEGQQCTENINECDNSPCENEALCSDTPGSYICDCPLGYGGPNCGLTVNECESMPCQNDGACTDLMGQYSCQCVVGFTGINCEFNIDDCAGISCSVPNTVCVDMVNAYICKCKPGFVETEAGEEGVSAEECLDVNECQSDPCQNQGTCLNKEDAFECQCLQGYTGSTCETDIDECDGGPCDNGARCRDQVNGFTCECLTGYTGELCETNIDDCQPQPCKNRGECSDLVDGYNCSCVAGWTGIDCQTQINECQSGPCQNGGICHDMQNMYECVCQPGFTGGNCEVNIDECVGDPCEHEGICVDEVNQYSCNCTADWMGQNCTKFYDACFTEPCQNEAQCITTQPSHEYSCNCKSGFEGESCEVNIDDCVGHTCQWYEVCVDGVNDYSCECPIGFTGFNCSEDIDECVSSPCGSGSCENLEGRYECVCISEEVSLVEYTNDERSVYKIGYEGLNCEININECELQPPICLNNGICQDSVGGFTCYCAENSVGRFCEVRLSYCTIKENSLNESVCHNDGNCVDDGPYQYKCNCKPGWTGKRCKVNINECDSNPCEYNSTCEDLVNDYNCQCPAGLTGKNCETNIDECDPDPCLSGGECIDKLNGYVCNCTDTGFKGSTCEFNIDECESNPCQNGATCQDGVKDYACICYPGYTGVNCEVDILECDSSPCLNNGTCLENSDKSRPDYSVTTAEGYTCECVPGFTGITCETNIDECESSPCVNGDCKDSIDSFECGCFPGYQGVTCDTEIDECVTYSPCLNGATCQDKLADYSCTCAPANAEGKQYGGKNCSIELIGCVDHVCQSEAVCVPYLNDSMHQVYRCECPNGFTGRYCNHRTTVSFRRETWMKYNSSETTSIEISLRFRTTLPDGVLVLNLANLKTKYFALMLKNSNTLVFVYNNSMVSRELTIQTPSQAALNDGLWHMVKVSVQWYGVVLNLTHQDCGGEEDLCSARESIDHSSLMHTLAETYFGYETSAVSSDVKAAVLSNLPGFVGCMQDIVVNTDPIVPLDYIHSGHATVSLKCEREEQCDPDPCHGNGMCNDLWYEYSCTCDRPFRGLACSESFIPATFGFEGESSVAKFVIAESEQEQMRRDVDMSVFIRTREREGLLFYIGGDQSDTEPKSQTYIVLLLSGGYVKADIYLDETLQSIVIENVPVNDGNLHLVQLTLKSQNVTINVDNTKQTLQVPNHLDLNAKHLYMGGLPSTSLQNSRKKRQVTDPVINYSAPNFKGTMQDVRLNGKLLQFYPVNVTSEEELPESFPIPSMTNVREGEQTDDLCTLLIPCQNNGTCTNQFYNDYNCLCIDGYKGKNCTELDFCLNTQCPMESTCNDLSDGFECVIPATFDGSYVQYRPNLGAMTEMNKFSVKFRTRANSGILFHGLGPEPASISNLNQFVTLEILQKNDSGSAEARKLSIQMDLGGALFEYLLPFQADGAWHELKMEIALASVKLDLDGAITEKPHSFNHTNLHRLFSASSQIFLGGVRSDYDARYLQSSVINYFKGCLDEARLGGVLLPFFEKDKFINFTASTSFDVLSISASVGCKGDPVCDSNLCENGATCMDEWNAFKCNCILGYDGTYCEYNIDDCQNNDCQNGATCLDGIAEYTCDCIQGFTGTKCEENIDECMSDSCYNNGTCLDGVNGYTCNCSEEYFGKLCEITLGETCLGAPCWNNATCVNVTVEFDNITSLSYNCTCLPGFTGVDCEVEIDFCENNPCRNGTCESITALENYICTCDPGTNCDVDIDECANSPCENGQCNDLIAKFECDCFGGWEGEMCEWDIDECDNNMTEICNNGGVCINTNGSYFCNCTDTGYEGMNCTEDIDECSIDPNPCYNDGVCENFPGSYECNCTLGYFGDNCESANCTDICENGATCNTVDNGDYESWECECLPFFEGDTCDFRGLCVDEPCENGATCTQNRTHYFCECTEGWTGENCTEDVDECSSPPCVNGGTCNNFDGGYNCTCVPGYEGAHCEVEIDECESSPCVNGGECIDEIGGYECNCTGTGYNGTNCEIDIDECRVLDPCQNGGTCVNLVPFYECDCVDGYVGDTCHSENPCYDTDYCLNNGACDYTIDDVAKNVTVECTCRVGYVGDTCHSENPCNDTDYCSNDGACDYTVDDVAKNVTVECTCVDSWDGPRCQKSPFTQDNTPEPREIAEDDDMLAIIIGVCVGAVVVIIVFIVVIVWVMRVKDKRATRGTYSPSRQEMSGSRMDMGNSLKVPPPERLI